jgi:hypothetical protein
VGIEPDEADVLLSNAGVSANAGKSAYGDGVVTAQDDWKPIVRQRVFDKARQMLAGLQNLLQELASAVAVMKRLGDAHRNISCISDFVAERGQPVVEFCHPHSAWPHIHAAAAGT